MPKMGEKQYFLHTNSTHCIVMTADIISMAPVKSHATLHTALAAVVQTHLLHRRDAVLALMRAGQLRHTA